LVGRALE